MSLPPIENPVGDTSTCAIPAKTCDDDYLMDNYHCTARGELGAATTRDPFQVI
jgi:hypothetical protein